MGRDLTQGSIIKNLLFLAIPTMIGFIFQTVYDLISIFWIGKISSEAIAGVTIFTAIHGIVMVLNEVIGVSSITLISRAYGEGDLEKTKKAIEQTIVFKFIVAVAASLILLMTLDPILRFFTDDQLAVQYAMHYGIIRSLAVPLFFTLYSVNTSLRCIGDSKKPLYIMAISAILNIILDPFFIFDTVPVVGTTGLGLGVQGAALATVLSVAIACAFGFWLLLSGKSFVRISPRSMLKIDKVLSQKLILIGLPSGVELLFRSTCNFLVLKMVAVYGIAAVAAMGIGNNLVQFVILPLLGFSMGGSIIVGQNLGIHNVERAEKTSKTAAKLCASIACVCSIIAIVFPGQIMAAFTGDVAVIEAGVPMLRFLISSLIFVGVIFGLGTVFTGSGYNLPMLIASIIARWGIQIPLFLLLIFALHVKLHFVWSVFIIAEFAELSIVAIFYKRGRWKTNKI